MMSPGRARPSTLQPGGLVDTEDIARSGSSVDGRPGPRPLAVGGRDVLRGIPPQFTGSSHPPDRVIRGPGPVRTVRSVATYWRPSPDSPQSPRAYRRVGPEHDRIDLMPAELRVVS